jgi:hypothetical protein
LGVLFLSKVVVILSDGVLDVVMLRMVRGGKGLVAGNGLPAVLRDPGIVRGLVVGEESLFLLLVIWARVLAGSYPHFHVGKLGQTGFLDLFSHAVFADLSHHFACFWNL